MTARPAHAHARSGITLTEILISILIMGIGLISLATLFPLGLIRLREANRQTRSGFLGESATADLGSKNLLFKPSFLIPWYGASHDPFVSDLNQKTAANSLTSLAIGQPTGLPICYDPLWREQTGVYPLLNGNIAATALPSGAQAAEARFGCGVFGPPGGETASFLRTDPGGGYPSGYGLQRITNFAPASVVFSGYTWPYLNAAATFVSPDDPVMQNSDAPAQILTDPSGNASNSALSGVVPQNFSANTGSFAMQNDFRYSWFFTGYQVDVLNGTVFVGDVVVCDSRPLAYESVTSPTNSAQSAYTAAGEIVLEAIFGYSTTIVPTGTGYGAAADRIVLLRWPSTMPDPEIKSGSWIADVTYERSPTTTVTRVSSATTHSDYPYQRCHWYQVAKKGEVTAGAVFSTDSGVTYRQMVVYTNTPMKARTLLSGGQPVHVNVGLYMPSVVNVFPRTVFARTDR